MNPKTLIINLGKCQLCEVRTSQFHHYFPAVRNGEKTGSKSGVYLCPNHHNMANILQLQLENFIRSQPDCMPDEFTPEEFTHLHVFFDEIFIKEAIPNLLMGYIMGLREHLVKTGVYDQE